MVVCSIIVDVRPRSYAQPKVASRGPVHIRDVTALAVKHLDVPSEFRSGKYVEHTTSNNVSVMVLSQCNGRNISRVKGSGNQGAL